MCRITFCLWHVGGGDISDLFKAIVYLSDSTMWGVYGECVYGSFGGMVLLQILSGDLKSGHWV